MAAVAALADTVARLGAGQPLLVALLLFAATFLLEDAATLAAGALAAHMLIDVELALVALVLGTFAGDAALYGAGRLAAQPGHGIGWVARLARRARERQRQTAATGLVAAGLARFVPGARLPTFVACGIAAVPVLPLLTVLAATTLVWTPLLFFTGSVAAEIAAAGWPVVVVAAMALIVAAMLRRRLPRLSPAIVSH